MAHSEIADGASEFQGPDDYVIVPRVQTTELLEKQQPEQPSDDGLIERPAEQRVQKSVQERIQHRLKHQRKQPEAPDAFYLPPYNGIDLFEISVDELQGLFSYGVLSSLQYTQICLDRIQKVSDGQIRWPA